ncbi:MAG: NAAT family transporter, partial [Methanoregulaceae archaeon]|nr:NAAT family transporter [Methanoregulaceae archaeon]
MAGDTLTFSLLALSSLIIIVNPLAATLTFVSLTSGMEEGARLRVAGESCRYALIILVVFALLGGIILQLFGITIEAFRIGGGILLFLIGMEMVYARTSRAKLTATEKYESREAEDISMTPLAIPMIAGPGAITTTIVLMNEAVGSYLEAGIVIASIVVSILLTFVMMSRSDIIVAKVGQKEFRAV